MSKERPLEDSTDIDSYSDPLYQQWLLITCAAYQNPELAYRLSLNSNFDNSGISNSVSKSNRDESATPKPLHYSTPEDYEHVVKVHRLYKQDQSTQIAKVFQFNRSKELKYAKLWPEYLEKVRKNSSLDHVEEAILFYFQAIKKSVNQHTIAELVEYIKTLYLKRQQYPSSAQSKILLSAQNGFLELLNNCINIYFSSSTKEQILQVIDIQKGLELFLSQNESRITRKDSLLNYFRAGLLDGEGQYFDSLDTILAKNSKHWRTMYINIMLNVWLGNDPYSQYDFENADDLETKLIKSLEFGGLNDGIAVPKLLSELVDTTLLKDTREYQRYIFLGLLAKGDKAAVRQFVNQEREWFSLKTQGIYQVRILSLLYQLGFSNVQIQKFDFARDDTTNFLAMEMNDIAIHSMIVEEYPSFSMSIFFNNGAQDYDYDKLFDFRKPINQSSNVIVALRESFDNCRFHAQLGVACCYLKMGYGIHAGIILKKIVESLKNSKLNEHNSQSTHYYNNEQYQELAGNTDSEWLNLSPFTIPYIIQCLDEVGMDLVSANCNLTDAFNKILESVFFHLPGKWSTGRE